MARFPHWMRWLYPGMGVKRWLLLTWLGLALFTVGIVLFVNWRVDSWVDVNLIGEMHLLMERMNLPWVSYLLLSALGLGMMILGIRHWFGAIYRVLVPHASKQLVDVMYEKTSLANPFRLVAMGGGSGLSSLLRGLKACTGDIVAVVTVSDDGGSSGRLRKDLGVLPPGDIRNCLVALADDDATLSSLFQYRFTEGSDLAGHSFGNLFLAALTGVAGGDFDRAVKLSSQILAVRGRVLPGTLSQTVLCAEFTDGTVVEGESEIPRQRKPIKRVWLSPSECRPQDEVLEAIRQADAIILGPGSLFTSVVPNLLVPGVLDALSGARGLRIYVCNVMTQPGETDGFTASDHVRALQAAAGRNIIDVALVNDRFPTLALDRYAAEDAHPVAADVAAIESLGVRAVGADLISETDYVRHDPASLAETISRLIVEHVERGYSRPREGFQVRRSSR